MHQTELIEGPPLPRLFVAIEPPLHIKALLLSLMDGVPDARWQGAAQLHLTLRFIGEVDDTGRETIVRTLRGLNVSRFDLALSGIGVFERRGRVDTLWAGLAPSASLLTLQGVVEQAAISAGLPPEDRPYNPHITLARLNHGMTALEAFLERHRDLTSPHFPVEDICLYGSRLSDEGSVYTVLERFGLK